MHSPCQYLLCQFSCFISISEDTLVILTDMFHDSCTIRDSRSYFLTDVTHFPQSSFVIFEICSSSLLVKTDMEWNDVLAPVLLDRVFHRIGFTFICCPCSVPSQRTYLALCTWMKICAQGLALSFMIMTSQDVVLSELCASFVILKWSLAPLNICIKSNCHEQKIYTVQDANSRSNFS